MNCVQRGAYQAVRNCVRLKPGEKMVIITDYETREIASELEQQAKLLSACIDVYFLEDYGNPPRFPEEIKRSLLDADVSFYAAQSKQEGVLESFVLKMLETVETNKKLRHAHCPQVDRYLMCTSMLADPLKIKDLNDKLMQYLTDANSVVITTPAGTNLTVALSSKYNWVSDTGIIEPGKWDNLPSGELWTCPLSNYGTIVVDGIIGDHFCAKFGLLDKTPVTLATENGRVTDISCKNKALEQKLLKYCEKDKNANRIGELGIGTNYCSSITDNATEAEKAKGSIHMAIGDPMGNLTGAEWESIIHADCVLRRPTLEVDGRKIMEEGKFLI